MVSLAVLHCAQSKTCLGFAIVTVYAEFMDDYVIDLGFWLVHGRSCKQWWCTPSFVLHADLHVERFKVGVSASSFNDNGIEKFPLGCVVWLFLPLYLDELINEQCIPLSPVKCWSIRLYQVGTSRCIIMFLTLVILMEQSVRNQEASFWWGQLGKGPFRRLILH